MQIGSCILVQGLPACVRVYIVCECVWVIVVRGCLRQPWQRKREFSFIVVRGCLRVCMGHSGTWLRILFFFPMCQSRPDLILKPHNDLEALALAELAKSPRCLFVLILVHKQFLQASCVCWLCGCIYVRLCYVYRCILGPLKHHLWRMVT